MEKEKQFYKELPTGTGRESEPKETLPAVEVDNEVEWVNPDFEKLPFSLKEGEPTKLGVFLTPKPKEEEQTVDLKVSREHGRSALLGRAIFQDKQRHLYRDLELKGIGTISGSLKAGTISSRREGTTWGILYLDNTLRAKEVAEEFLKAGIRAERYIAIIRLNEIVDEKGKKISIEEARKREMINLNQEPVIGLRAFGTKFRIEDAKKKEILEDARHLVAQELGIKEKDFSWEEYLKWFIKTAGENLGLMHKNKWFHNYLSPHNITLDCRIVDLDSVKSFQKEKDKEEKMEHDYKSLESTLLNPFGLFRYVLEISPGSFPESPKKLFSQVYQETLGYTPKFLAEEKEEE